MQADTKFTTPNNTCIYVYTLLTFLSVPRQIQSEHSQSNQWGQIGHLSPFWLTNHPIPASSLATRLLKPQTSLDSCRPTFSEPWYMDWHTSEGRLVTCPVSSLRTTQYALVPSPLVSPYLTLPWTLVAQRTWSLGRLAGRLDFPQAVTIAITLSTTIPTC